MRHTDEYYDLGWLIPNRSELNTSLSLPRLDVRLTIIYHQTGLPSKATLSALNSSGSKIGGILSGGTLSSQTPGTMTISGSTSSFTMKSSKGLCAVQSGELTCASSISTGTSFSAVSITPLAHPDVGQF